MKIFLICPVRNATEQQKAELKKYIATMEENGNVIYYPPRDTDQSDPIGYDICSSNLQGIIESDEVHIYYDKTSTGSHFDLGMAFALGKPLKVLNDTGDIKGKAFSNMMRKWEEVGY